MSNTDLSGERSTVEQDVQNAAAEKFTRNVTIFLISAWQMGHTLKLRDGSRPEIENYLKALESATRILISELFLIETINFQNQAKLATQSGPLKTDSPTPLGDEFPSIG